jgi:hypothetical protein
LILYSDFLKLQMYFADFLEFLNLLKISNKKINENWFSCCRVVS